MKILFLILALAACSGCAVLDNLEGALTLQELSREKDAQHDLVKAHDARVDALFAQLAAPDALKRYLRKDDIQQDFGDPVLCRNEAGFQKCLWRKIADPGKSPKVYIYFDAQGGLVRWEKP